MSRKRSRLVLIAELPPASGLYFYNPNGRISEPLVVPFTFLQPRARRSFISSLLRSCNHDLSIRDSRSARRPHRHVRPGPAPATCEGRPSGYRDSGGYCAPTSDASVAVLKVGQCPSGFVRSGAYRRDTRSRVR